MWLACLVDSDVSFVLDEIVSAPCHNLEKPLFALFFGVRTADGGWWGPNAKNMACFPERLLMDLLL